MYKLASTLDEQHILKYQQKFFRKSFFLLCLCKLRRGQLCYTFTCMDMYACCIMHLNLACFNCGLVTKWKTPVNPWWKIECEMQWEELWSIGYKNAESSNKWRKHSFIRSLRLSSFLTSNLAGLLSSSHHVQQDEGNFSWPQPLSIFEVGKAKAQVNMCQRPSHEILEFFTFGSVFQKYFFLLVILTESTTFLSFLDNLHSVD